MPRILLDDPARSGGTSELEVGSSVNDGTGNPLRTGGQRLKLWAADINAMMVELYIAWAADTTSATLVRATRNFTGSHNEGQAATVTNAQTLWSGQAGDRFAAAKTASTTTGKYIIRPNGSQSIGSGAVGKGVIINDVGTILKLHMVKADLWSIESASGDYEYEV